MVVVSSEFVVDQIGLVVADKKKESLEETAVDMRGVLAGEHQRGWMFWSLSGRTG